MYGDGFTWRSTRYTSNGSTGSIEVEALREHDLEDVAGEDVLLRRLDRLRPRVRLVTFRRSSGSSMSSSAGGSEGTYGSGRPSSASARSRRAAAASYSARELGVVRARRREHVLDQVEPLAEVVERGDVPGERQHRVGHARDRRRGRREALDLAHDVVAELADDAAVERRQLGELRRAVRARAAPRARRARPGRTGTPSAGSPPSHSTSPPAHHERERRIAAEEREPAPALGVLDRLEQEALAVADELHERRDRRLEVGEHLAPDRARPCSRARARRTRRATGCGRRSWSLTRVRASAPLAEGAEEAAALAGVARAPSLLLDDESRTSTSQS